MYGALPTRPRLGLKPQPNCPISALDDGLIVAIFAYLKPNHLRFTADTLRADGTVTSAEKGYRCSSDNSMRMGELVQYVSIVELIQCSMVCRQWRRCAQLRALWEEADLSKFRDAVNDDLVLRIAQKAGRRLRSLCLNHCVRITDVSMYHLSTHCPLITELHIQGCTQLSASAVLNLMRTLAYRNGLLRKPAVLSIELAKCAFLSPSVLEEIEKALYTASRDANATGRRRRAGDAELARRTDDRPAHSGAPAPAAHACARVKRAQDAAQNAEDRWRSTFELDVGLCNLCNSVVDLSDGGRCSLCASVTCERCSDTPSTCELCCESFCNDCRLVATCVSCMKDYCEDCQEVLMCGECDAVLCPECHSEHVCPVDTLDAPAPAACELQLAARASDTHAQSAGERAAASAPAHVRRGGGGEHPHVQKRLPVHRANGHPRV